MADFDTNVDHYNLDWFNPSSLTSVYDDDKEGCAHGLGCVFAIFGFLFLGIGFFGEGVEDPSSFLIPGTFASLLSLIIFSLKKCFGKFKSYSGKKSKLQKALIDNAPALKELKGKYETDYDAYLETARSDMSEEYYSGFCDSLFASKPYKNRDELIKYQLLKYLSILVDFGVASRPAAFALEHYGNMLILFLKNEKNNFFRSVYDRYSGSMLDSFRTLGCYSVPCIVNETVFKKDLKKAFETNLINLSREEDRNRFVNCYVWLTKLEKTWSPFRKYNMSTLKEAKKDFFEKGEEAANGIWLDYPEKVKEKAKDILEQIEADFRKDMSEIAYWSQATEDKRERAISRYMREVKMDLEELGPERTLELWLGFVKRNIR